VTPLRRCSDVVPVDVRFAAFLVGLFVALMLVLYFGGVAVDWLERRQLAGLARRPRG
jgi:hypothetical protein